MALCIIAGGAVLALAVQGFTLAWTHSIEKIRWEEDYRIEGQMLRLTEARIRGSGAGMDPPEGARLIHGVWHYRPALGPLPALRLAQSPYVAGYELCIDARCQPLSRRMPQAADGVVVIRACPDLPSLSARAARP
jgi:hypothetical protein